ncbi:OmpA family protein [Puteibacter caeruleilacunae]|nr:OmpA family protein [Puteibacter caeruleilacunae]
MRKILLLCFGLLLSSSLVIAQNADNKWGLGIGTGPLQYKGEIGDQYNKTKDFTFGLEASLIRYLSPSFEGLFNLGYNKLKESGGPGDMYNMNGSVITTNLGVHYKFNNGYIFKENSFIQPYLLLGAGMMFGSTDGVSADNGSSYDDSNSAFNLAYGFGTKLRFSETVSMFIEAQDRIVTSDDFDAATADSDNDKFRKFSVGLIFTLGKAKDSDQDGVIDRKDKCPGTPLGVKVDADGCPLDTDGDGIADYLDDCPDTPGLEKFNGCPDTDGDGIPDPKDKCPTVPGLKELEGCPDGDDDKDGVLNLQDKCPNTPAGYKVDTDGCPIDTDKDGLVDEEDECPNEPGPKNNNGCPLPPSAGPIYFKTDSYKLSAESIKILDEAVKILEDRSKLNVVISGHADERGSNDYNEKLSENRANAVQNYLVSKNITEARISAEWHGETKPAMKGGDESAWAKNRCVVLIFK